MRVSINVTNYSWPGGPPGLGAELARLARAADQAGLDTVWVSDHLVQADPTAAPGDTEMLEGYTTLGFLAAQTERVRLGTMVTGVTFRPPALLVKAVTTLDVLSGGRAWLGIGAGYQEEEAQAMGLPLPPVAERFERLEETLQIAARMWAGDDAPFVGRHYRLRRPTGSRPHRQAQARRPRPALRPARSALRGGREDAEHPAGAGRVRRRVRRPVRGGGGARHRPRGGHHPWAVDGRRDRHARRRRPRPAGGRRVTRSAARRPVRAG
jgi:alkanesulfonate monooxygenase SsuD/methylene tetrahydromethanopterin reductase-like flavin-dependent oxidoreductase (luciferase family)